MKEIGIYFDIVSGHSKRKALPPCMCVEGWEVNLIKSNGKQKEDDKSDVEEGFYLLFRKNSLDI